MDIRRWLQEVAILIVVYKITAAESDLLESVQLREDNPRELNEFLNSVLDHQKDFMAVQEAARNYQKIKKEVNDFKLDSTLGTIMDPYHDIYNNKNEEKRHISHYNGKRKFRNLGLLPPNMRNKFQRTRRGIKGSTKSILKNNENRLIKKRFPEILMLEQVPDDSVKKRQPMVMEEVAPKIKHHLPSQIYVEPQGEQLQKRTPEEVVVQSEAENGEINIDNKATDARGKKEALDLATEVHHGYKNKGGKVMRDDMKGSQQGDVFYVDLDNGAKRKEQTEKQVYGWNLRRQGFYYPPGPYENQMYRPRPESFDYSHYPNSHRQGDDDLGFEKALSYEVEPRYHNQKEMYNNPAGNNLYSVDAGRPENYQPFYPQLMYQPMYGPPAMEQHQYPPQNQMDITNEKFIIDNDDSLKRVQTTTTDSSTNSIHKSNDGKKIVGQVGKGFIEITKSRRDNTGQNSDENLVLEKKSLRALTEKLQQGVEGLRKNTNDNKEQSSTLLKHSLHPLRVKDTRLDEEEESMFPNEEIVEDQDDKCFEKKDTNKITQNEDQHFQARNLKFIDYENTNFYNQDENYEEVPLRSRRDFLDALGMKNEEEYSEDNPFSEEMHVNNTDVQNDTHIKKTTYSHNHQKEDMKHIVTILEEALLNRTTNSTSPCPNKITKKHAKNNMMPLAYLDDHGKKNNMDRKSRDTSKDLETKILANKDKIYNEREKKKNHVQIRQDPILNKWSVEIPKLNLRKYITFKHKLDKKEDSVFGETTEKAELTETLTENLETTTENLETTKENLETTAEQTTAEFTTEVDGAYKHMAHQMDIENEKLAQVIKGQLASKIVTLVFDMVTKKNSLRTKISSGLSRKHVNFIGTPDSNIFKGNETEDVNEAHLLLDQISKVLNKLVINQVRRKLCQRLPEELKEYLNLIINVQIGGDKEEFVPNEQQGDFLFTYQEKKDTAPPFNISKLQNILVKLEGLLLAYNNMNSDCQNKAEPVRDYIENHVKMLKQIVNCPKHNCDDKYAQAKRNIEHLNTLNKDLVEEQLESVGLGKNQEFVPNFDLNQLIKNKMASSLRKTDQKRETQNEDFKSAQYKKLQLAVEKIREKRENEKKIAEMFGGKQKRSLKKLDVDYEEPVVYSLG